MNNAKKTEENKNTLNTVFIYQSGNYKQTGHASDFGI